MSEEKIEVVAPEVPEEKVEMTLKDLGLDENDSYSGLAVNLANIAANNKGVEKEIASNIALNYVEGFKDSVAREVASNKEKLVEAYGDNTNDVLKNIQTTLLGVDGGRELYQQMVSSNVIFNPSLVKVLDQLGSIAKESKTPKSASSNKVSAPAVTAEKKVAGNTQGSYAEAFSKMQDSLR